MSVTGIDRSTMGLVRIQGREAATFLHGYVTQDVKGLPVGQVRPAVVTTWKGTMLDLVRLGRDADGYWLLTSPGQATRVRQALARFLINVEATVELGAPCPILHLHGEEAAARLAAAGVTAPAPGALTVAGELMALEAWPWPGWYVLAPAADPRWEALRAGLAPLDPAAVEVWRVTQGIPASAHEITEAYNPWEARLARAVSLDKGCYLGQEVIARLAHYHKVQRQLMGLELEEALPLPPGASIRQGETTLGALTSQAGTAGLAILKREAALPGERVTVGEARVPATLVDRPFWLEQAGGGLEPELGRKAART